MRAQQKLAATPSRKSIPILLVDDDVQLCSSLKRLLGMDGFEVKAVHDGESGVRHALEGKYELVVLDVMLPGGDGRKVLRRVRLASQVPVIMLTARGDEADRIAGLECEWRGHQDDPGAFTSLELQSDWDTYTQAVTPTKRAAQTKLIKMILLPGKPAEEKQASGK